MVDQKIKDAVKKCNPQKAVLALGEIMDTYTSGQENIRSIAVNAQAIADQALTQSASASTKADNAVALGQNSVIALSSSGDASTANVIGTKNNGESTIAPLPVASLQSAGVMNTATYATVQETKQTVEGLVNSTLTYLVTLPNDDPTQAEINTAYQTAYPTAPFPPLDGCTVIDQNRQLFYRWVRNGALWIKTTGFIISQWTNETAGTVKGSTTAGQIQAEPDGTGSLVGYDAIISNINALTTRVSNAESSVTSLTTQVDANTEEIAYNRARVIERLQATGGSIDGVSLSVINPDNVLINDVIIPVVNSTTSGVITPAMYTQWNSGGNGGSIISTATTNFTTTLELVTPEEWEFTLKIDTNKNIVLTAKLDMSLLVHFSTQTGSHASDGNTKLAASLSYAHLGTISNQLLTYTYSDIEVISLTNSKVRHIGIVSQGGSNTTVRVLNLV